jgi:hypothetical protein
VNAAFLLVTTAWIAGADAAPPPAPAAKAAAPVYSVGTAGGCGAAGCGGCSSCGCDSCCESEGFFSRLKGHFHRSSCDCGCESEGFFSRLKGRFHHGDDCGCDTGCGSCGSTCDSGCGGHSFGLRDRLRGLFHRGDDCGCCDSGCGGCASGGVITPVPAGGMKGEPIGPPKEGPKKLPSGDVKKGGSAQLIPQSSGVPVLEVAPTSAKSPF